MSTSREFLGDVTEPSGRNSSLVARMMPHVHESGSGPAVVCVHANASTSGQWRSLADALAGRFRVVAPDLYGAGGSPQWPSERIITLGDEVELLRPILSSAEAPVALVGHSYGACVCLLAVLAGICRPRALVLYEPTLFALLDKERMSPNEADGIRQAVAEASAALDAGRPEHAAERFIEYWMGPGSWRAMPEPRRRSIEASVRSVRRWGHALFSEPTPLESFRWLDVPVLYMTGERSTAAALGVARLLTAVLPRVQVVRFPDLGHMGPVTHPGVVNAAIERFLVETLPSAAEQAPRQDR